MSLIQDNFRRHILVSAAESPRQSPKTDLFRKSKVSQLNVALSKQRLLNVGMIHCAVETGLFLPFLCSRKWKGKTDGNVHNANSCISSINYLSNKRFSGFKSLYMIPFLCKYSIASIQQAIMNRPVSGENFSLSLMVVHTSPPIHGSMSM